MYKVIKRDGAVVDFDVSKIKRAIIKAFESVDRSYTDDIIDFIVLKVTADFEKKLNKETGILGEGYKHDTITVEDIQDSVETVLVKSGYDQVAKSFILYRQQHAKMRSVKNTLLDYKKTVEGYLGGSDWRVKENSTVNYSVGGLILNQAGAMTANYWLSEVYDGEVAAAHRNCDFHLHDLSMLSPYCCGHDLKRLITEGLGGVPGKISSGPAGHLSTLCNQMVNYLGCLQNEWSGAQAFSNFDTLLAPFVKKDNLSYKQVKQAIQSFVFGVNTPSRWGCQAPFSNVSIDWTMHPDLKDMPAIVGGVEQDFTYGDCEKEQAMINKAFMEVMMEGDYNGRGHQYPIPNYSITKEFKWDDSENNRLLFGMAAKYGIPYFSNYVNSDMDPREVKSMCPLTGDTNILVMVNDHMEVVAIEELHTNKFFNENEFKVTDGYKWYPAKTNVQEPTDVHTLYSHGKKLISMGINHLQPVYANEDGEQYTLDIEPDVNSKLITLPAKDIKAGAYIPKICGRKPGVRPIQVTSIEFDAPQPLYCLEVDSEEHVFALANGVLTHNCRLRLDMREVVKKNGGGLFGAQSKTGSVAVVTLNMPRLGYLAKDEDDFFKRLDRLMDIAARSLHTRRQAVTQLMDAGLYPYTKHYIGSFNTYFSTIATVGMNEMCKNARWLRSPIHEKAGQEFTIKVLKYMVARLPKYQMEYDAMYNLESAPAESCSFRLAKHDKERYPDIITAGTESSPYYTNSSNIEVGHTANIYEALENQDPIQILYTSGTVFHAYLGEQLPDWKAAATIVKKICENYRLPYITLSPTYSVCPEHGYIPGAHTTCPHCKTSNGEITNG